MKGQKLLVKGEHISAIAALSTNGIVGLKIVRGGVDGGTFYDFVSTSLLHQLMPYNDTNQHSVVIMDNCSTHHVDEFEPVITVTGALTYVESLLDN